MESADWFWRVWEFVTHRRTRYVVAWIVVLVTAGVMHYYARRNFMSRDTEPELRRRDGDSGHCTIDFGGQWLMGRMLARGYGRELYHLPRQYEVALQAYPRENEAPAAKTHDVDELIGCFMDCEVHGDEKYREVRIRHSRVACGLPIGSPNALQAAIAAMALQQEGWVYESPGGTRQPIDGPHTPQRIEEMRRPVKHLGGPLYPPIHALLIAPLALVDEPQLAYRFTQWLMLGMAFVGGLGVSVLTKRRIWWPVATMLILFFPGFRGSHHLAQNAALSLAILIWGWVLMNRGREWAGGALWGLLAFKPTIALAFLLVPILTRRWKACAGMIAVGAGLALLTLPFVGIQTWLDWLQVGRLANETYNVDENWIFLSRDLISIPRRFLVDFQAEYMTRDHWYIALAGWAIWIVVFETTLRVANLRRDDVRKETGPAAAVVLIGAWASCFHFMYYDALLAFPGFIVLIAEPKRLVQPLLALFPKHDGMETITPALARYFEPRLAATHPVLASNGRPLPRVFVANSFLLYSFAALMIAQHLFPWLSATGTFIATNWFPEIYKTTRDADGTRFAREPDTAKTTETIVYEGGKAKTVFQAETKTAVHTPKLQITTNTIGPPWDTFTMLVIWTWACVMALRAPAPKNPGLSEMER